MAWRRLRRRPVILTGVLCLLLTARGEIMLGRCPRPGLEDMLAGPFVQSDLDDVLGVEFIGTLPAATRPGRTRTEPRLFRLALLRLFNGSVREIWRSSPLLADPIPEAMLAPNPWTTIDIDGNGRVELLIFFGEHCRIVSFGPESLSKREFALPGAWVIDAVAADFNDDGRDVLVTLEAATTDSLLETRLLRVYAVSDSGFYPLSDYLAGLSWYPDTDLRFAGSSRIEGYPGRLPILAGTRQEPGPSTLATLYLDDTGQYRFTCNPFPLREWFTKDEVLPGGRFVVSGREETLVAYGYFVPGSRPGGPSVSFAALEDGAWHLLPVSAQARQIGWPACPYRHEGRPGWLELRDGIFRFHPEPVFDR